MGKRTIHTLTLSSFQSMVIVSVKVSSSLALLVGGSMRSGSTSDGTNSAEDMICGCDIHNKQYMWWVLLKPLFNFEDSPEALWYYYQTNLFIGWNKCWLYMHTLTDNHPEEPREKRNIEQKYIMVWRQNREDYTTYRLLQQLAEYYPDGRTAPHSLTEPLNARLTSSRTARGFYKIYIYIYIHEIQI